MVRTRNQLRIEENEEIEMVSKFIKIENEEVIEAEVVKDPIADSSLKNLPSTSKFPATETTYSKIDPIPFPLKPLLDLLKINGFSLPRITKRLRNAVELVESDDVEGSVMIMIYLHNTNHDSKDFVEYVFTEPRFLDIVRNHFVLWAADMSEEEDKAILEKEIEEELSIDVVELLRQYEMEQFPLLLVVSLLDGKHQVLKVFSGVKDVETLYQELTESIFIHKELRAELEEGDDDTDVVLEGFPAVAVEEDVTFPCQQQPVVVKLLVNQFVHLAEFSTEMKLRDLLQYVATNTGLKIGQFSLSSFPGTDLTLLWDWDNFTLDMVGMKGGRKTTLRINIK